MLHINLVWPLRRWLLGILPALLCVWFVRPEVVPVVPVDYAAIVSNQIMLLKSVAQARKTYFLDMGTYQRVQDLLDAALKNVQRLSRDQNYPEPAWFLEEIARVVGSLGSDYASGKDVSGAVQELFRQAKKTPLRAWSTAFCIVAMRTIFDQLASAVQLIPASGLKRQKMIEEGEEPEALLTRSPRKRKPGGGGKKMMGAVIGSVLGVGAVAGLMLLLYKKQG